MGLKEGCLWCQHDDQSQKMKIIPDGSDCFEYLTALNRPQQNGLPSSKSTKVPHP